jgi:hypothetical protein
MKSHRRSRRRIAALALAACAALAAPAAPAGAMPAGDRPQPVSTKIGDTPADYPGASRSPRYDPPTRIVINRPVRTIVRDVDDALPTVLAGLALFIALGAAGFALIRTRSLNRALLGHPH